MSAETRLPQRVEEIPREVQEALVLDHQARYYRKWLDESIPALGNRTPKEAAREATVRPALVGLIRRLEGMYQVALKTRSPAYDPSWMWAELGLAEGEAAHPPPLGHERMMLMVGGFGDVCRRVADGLRRRPGFDDRATIASSAELRANLQVQRFLRRRPEAEAARLAGHLAYTVNYELHRRKTFWVSEPLAYMLAKTDLDVSGDALRVPFPSFALVFTDRQVLSLAERLISSEATSPLAGHFLKIVTVYVTEEEVAQRRRVLHLAFVLDALGADPPQLLTRDIVIAEKVESRALLEEPAFQAGIGGRSVPDADPLRGLLHVTANAILYSVSAGAERRIGRAPAGRRGAQSSSAPVFSSEEVYFLPGAIEISHLRRMQELDRVPSGRQLLYRFMVRGHWRRAAEGWRDQSLRWIKPYWKGPDIAAVIERTYRMVP